MQDMATPRASSRGLPAGRSALPASASTAISPASVACVSSTHLVSRMVVGSPGRMIRTKGCFLFLDDVRLPASADLTLGAHLSTSSCQ
jgi:hypothetical protein